MVRNPQVHKDFFWTGFFTGAFVGGALGVLLSSELGRRAYKQLESAAQEMRSRFNGRAASDEQEAAPSLSEEDVEHPT